MLVERGRWVFLANTIENLHTPPLRLSSNFALTFCLFYFLKKCKNTNKTQLLLLGKVEYGGGPIFKVVLEC